MKSLLTGTKDFLINYSTAVMFAIYILMQAYIFKSFNSYGPFIVMGLSLILIELCRINGIKVIQHNELMLNHKELIIELRKRI